MDYVQVVKDTGVVSNNFMHKIVRHRYTAPFSVRIFS